MTAPRGPGALPLFAAPPVDYGPDEAAMVAYRAAGTERALELDNRGPIRFDRNGALDPAILDAYDRHGFYILEGVLGPEERADLERDVADLLERAPTTKGADLDRHGRPALGADLAGRNRELGSSAVGPARRDRRIVRSPRSEDDRADTGRRARPSG